MPHHWISVLYVISAVLLADLATPPARLWSDFRVMHTWNAAPANWESLGPPPANTTIDLYIALKPHRESALVDALYEVSSPGHKKYGAHLSKEQVADLVAPHQDTLRIVHSWLEYHSVPSSSIAMSHGGGWLTVTGVPVAQAEVILCASYRLYVNTGADKASAILRTVSYALPAVLHAHVQTVAPTTHFAAPRTPLQTPRKHFNEETVVVTNATSEKLVRMVSSDGLVTPTFLRWLYHTQTYTPTAMDQNMLGTLGFLNDYPKDEDLLQFIADFRADVKDNAVNFNVVSINGAEYDPSNPGAIASINAQYTEAMAFPTPYIVYNTGGELQWSPGAIGGPMPDDKYLEWFRFLLAGPYIPPTISILYTNSESEFPYHYARALCDLFGQLGVRGVSVLVVSGDDGVGRDDCKDGAEKVSFVPVFPASCPWVTAVGGTTLHSPEVAVMFSGGGFSSHFDRPRYQDRAVSSFLQSLGTEYTGLYDSDGRGYPDISAQARQYLFFRNGVLYETSSTICSTSTVAGIVALLNDYRLSSGKPPLGFLNPWLYSDTLQVAGLNDITSGSNPSCKTDGFFSVVGWDPVTGLGTPDFEILQRSLPLEEMHIATTPVT